MDKFQPKIDSKIVKKDVQLNYKNLEVKNMKFSEKIMNLRKSKGWSQDEFAEKIGVTRQTVSKWELDKTVPDMNKLIEISKIFEISLDELTNQIETSKSKNVYKESSTEKNNKKISIRIFIIGIIISLILCGVGFIKQKNANTTNEERRQQALEQSQIAAKQANKRLEEINKEYETLEPQINSIKSEITTMRNEQQTIFMKDRGFSERYYSKGNEIDAKENELSKLQSNYTNLQQEQFRLQNKDYTVYYQLVEPITYNIFYYIGAGVFAIMSLIALIYFLVTRKK